MMFGRSLGPAVCGTPDSAGTIWTMSAEHTIIEFLTTRYGVPTDLTDDGDAVYWVDGPSVLQVAADLLAAGYKVSPGDPNQLLVHLTSWQDVVLARQLSISTLTVAIVRSLHADPTPLTSTTLPGVHARLVVHTFDPLLLKTTLPPGGLEPNGAVEEIAVQLVTDEHTGPTDGGEQLVLRVLSTLCDSDGANLLYAAELLAG
jgi:hypothetical protein